MTETAITLPLDAVESVVRSANRLGPQYMRPADRAALALVTQEVEQVRSMTAPEQEAKHGNAQNQA